MIMDPKITRAVVNISPKLTEKYSGPNAWAMAPATTLEKIYIYLIIYLLSLTRVTRGTHRVDTRVGHVDEEDGEGPEHPHRHAVLLLY